MLLPLVWLLGCGSSGAPKAAPPSTAAPLSTTSTSTTSATAPPVTTTTAAATTTTAAPAPPQPPAASPGRRVVAIDPGHNGANGSHPEEINRQVDIGNGTKACDTTGTETDDGYRESAFTFDVARRVRDLLEGEGVTVVLTRSDDEGVGPCIDERAAIGNRAAADAAISIHADGGPAGGSGFHVIEPARIEGLTDAIVEPSARLGRAVHDAYAAGTGLPDSSYAGSNGIDVRDDLGGLNRSTVPKVFIECANMRNAGEAALLSDPDFRQRIASGIVDGLLAYLSS
jgi:N-acetylmuramoyl-L-alanine amidase